ncbi:N-methyl-L-tryptophan oxidase [Microbacterium tumbae]
MDADVAIVGLGTMGSMAAWQLTRREGVRVLGFDQYGLGHARGAGAGESRLFRTAYHEGPSYVPLLLEARKLWLELERETGWPLYRQIGALSIGSTELPQMSRVVESIRTYDLPAELLDGDELARRFPQHRAVDGEMGILDLLGGALRPESAIKAALLTAERAGAELHGREPVIGIEPESDHVRVITSAGSYRAGHVIVTVGPWSREFLPDVSPALVVQRQALTWFVPSRPELFVAERFPAFIRDTEGVHIFGVPSLDGSTVKAGITPFWDHEARVEDVDRWLDPADVASIGDAVHAYIPDLGPEPARFDVYIESYVDDKTPRILRWQDSPRTTVLTGFSGHGFKLSPIFGRIAAQYALDGSTPYRVDPFLEPLPSA